MEANDQRVLFESFPKQDEFIEYVFDKSKDFILFGGAVRGGKTYVLLGIFILLCKIFPGSRWIVVRRTIEILKSTTLASFSQIYPRIFTLSKPSQSNGWEWKTTNGSVIKFFAENKEKDPDLFRFRGLEADGIGFDEMDVSEDCFNKAFERVGTWRMGDRTADMEKGLPIPPRKVLGTSNPQDGWLKKRVYTPFRRGELRDNWVYLESKVYDNPYVTSEYVERQRENLPPEEFEMFIEGNWDVDKNKDKFFSTYEPKIHFSDVSYEVREFEDLWFSFDFNYNPCTCTVYQKIEGFGVVLLYEFGMKGGTRVLCDEIVLHPEISKVPKWLWKVTGDSSGQNKTSTAGNTNDYDIICEVFGVSRKQLVNVSKRNKAHTYSRRVCREFLRLVPFVINPECEQIERDLRIAKPDKNGKLYKNRDQGYEMDYADTFRYFVHAAFLEGLKDIKNFVNTLE